MTPAVPDDRVAAANRDALAVLASVDGVGPARLESLLSAIGSPADVLRVAAGRNGAGSLGAAMRDAGPDHFRVTRATIDGVVQAARSADAILSGMRSSGVHALVMEDAAYPARLRTIEMPPRVLFVRGADSALEAVDAIAVVGTRRPTDLGRRTASRIGSALARAGALVVSGLALGIDGAAHAAALDASGTTVAVIGGGHGRLAPVAHDRLAAVIVERGGAVISEHAPDTKPTRGTFPRRNRIISGLVDAVIVVEAGVRSGALLTAAWALEQGRECFLVPGSIEDPESAGCLAWLREYSGLTRVVAGVPQLLEDLGLVAAAALAPRGERGAAAPDLAGVAHQGMRPPGGRVMGPSVDAVVKDLPDREGRLVRALAAGASTTDELAAVAQMPIGAVLAGLTVLEGRGVVSSAYGRYEFGVNGPSIGDS